MDVDPTVIRHLREARGMRQSDLAREAGLSRPYVSQLEAGLRNPSPLVASTLARVLGVEVETLNGAVTCPRCGAVFAFPA